MSDAPPKRKSAKRKPGWPNHKPPSGIPAYGESAGGPPQGPGWGGPAHPLRPAFTAEIAKAAKANANAGTGLTRQQRAEKLHDHLYDLALTAESQIVQANASIALLNRIEGMPVSRTINANVNADSCKTDAELRAELAELEAKVMKVRRDKDDSLH